MHKQELEAAKLAHAKQVETLTAELEAARATQASGGAGSAEVETLRRELEEERQKLKQFETAKEELVATAFLRQRDVSSTGMRAGQL